MFILTIQIDVLSVNAAVPDSGTRANLSPELASGDRIISSDELKMASLTDWWEAVTILEPSIFDEYKQVYGDMPGYQPASVSVRGKSHWLMNADETSLPLFIIDGARVPLRQMMNININDIAEVIIYKDPVSLSRFGINGADGVIEIKTRKPEAGKLKISYLFDAMFQKADKSLEKGSKKFEANCINTDWMSVPLHTGFQNRHKLDVEGGDDYVKYKFSARLSPGGSGVMKGSKNDIFGLNSYIEYNMKALHISNDIVFNQIKSKASNFGTYDFYRILSPEWIGIDNSGIPNSKLEVGGESLTNPIYEASLQSYDETKTYEVYDNLNVKVNLNNGISIDGLFAFARETSRQDIYISPSSGIYSDADAGENVGRYDILRDNTLSFEGSLFVKYGINFGKSRGGISAGVKAFSGKYYDEAYAGVGIPTDRMAYISFTKAYDTNQKPEAHRSYDHTLQVAASAHYSYDNRYSLVGSVNYNRSSRLSPGNRNAWFYGLGANWNIKNETFFKDTDIKRFDLNASIGTTGGVGFDDSDYNVTYTSNIGNEYIYNYYLIGSAIASMPNRDIKWSTTHNRNVALLFDYGCFNFRFDYYNNQTKNALIFAQLPLSTGWDNTISNGGEINNQGIEFRINSSVLKDENGWSLNIFAGGSHNRNKITQLPVYFRDLYNRQVEANRLMNLGAYRIVSELMEGCAVNGSIYPDFCGNLGASVRYKEWTLNAIADCRLGGKTYDWIAIGNSEDSSLIRNNEIRLSSLQLGYSFANHICKKMQMRDFSLILSGNNLIRSISSGATGGILYPMARTVTLSLRITL